MEDFPGLGKTLAARSFAQTLGLDFKRAQFTPDLLPGDITGLVRLRPARGRVRVPGRSALRRPAARRRDQPHAAEDPGRAARGDAGEAGDRRGPDLPAAPPLPRPRDGEPGRVRRHLPAARGAARPLPHAHLVRLPDASTRSGRSSSNRMARQREEQELTAVVDAEQLLAMQAAVEATVVDESVGRYCVALAAATRTHGDVLMGASPRGSLGLLLCARAYAVVDGRDYVTPEDVKAVAVPVLAHRITVKPELWMSNASGRSIVESLLRTVATPSAREHLATGPGRGRLTDHAAVATRHRTATRRLGGWEPHGCPPARDHPRRRGRHRRGRRPPCRPARHRRRRSSSPRSGGTWPGLGTRSRARHASATRRCARARSPASSCASSRRCPDVHGVVTLAQAPWVERKPSSGIAELEDGRSDPRACGPPAGAAAGSAPSASRSSAPGAPSAPARSTCRTSTRRPCPCRPSFDASAPTPHPRGIVGLNRSNRPGSGSRVQHDPPVPSRRPAAPHPLARLDAHRHACTSPRPSPTRTPTSSCSSTASATSGPGRASTDARRASTSRCARPGAISEHFLRSNDRLTLRTVGAAEVPTLGVGSGTNHLRRVLDTLAAISPATERRDTGERAVRGVDPIALCLVLSPLIDPTMVTLAHTLAARGHDGGRRRHLPRAPRRRPHERLRGAGLAHPAAVPRGRGHSLRLRGVPVVPWRGPGSLDQVLRDIARRASAPRMARR